MKRPCRSGGRLPFAVSISLHPVPGDADRSTAGPGRSDRRSCERADSSGLDLVRRLASTGAAEAATERGDGPVVDALLGASVTVVVITSRQVKYLRARYGAAGNKDDRIRRVRAGERALQGQAGCRCEA